MNIKKTQWMGIILALIVLIVDIIFFREDKIFFFLIGIAFVVGALPFIVRLLAESKLERQKNEKFLEFTRALAENVKGGTPIGRSIINMRSKNFGALTPHIYKLANQISIGIPISKAFGTFAGDIGSKTIRRAINLIKEAESSGGKIDDILDSVASSIYQIEKLKKERKATISNLIVQGYIIFFIFIGIMLVMQFKILPLTASASSIGIGGEGITGVSGDLEGSGNIASAEELARPFLFLLLVQGFFSGLAIGKLTEGSLKDGLKHSFILVILAFLISTGANVFI